LNSAISLDNCYETAWHSRGQTVNAWAKDSTGLVEYKFNSQGYRHSQTYDWPASWAFFGNSIVFGIGVAESDLLTSYFDHSQNYGLAGNYMNHHSVTNLINFLNSKCYTPQTQIVFFWIDRENEDVGALLQQVTALAPRCLHISSGKPVAGAINLMSHQDLDASGTHPGPKTHKMWAKTIRLLNRA